MLSSLERKSIGEFGGYVLKLQQIYDNNSMINIQNIYGIEIMYIVFKYLLNPCNIEYIHLSQNRYNPYSKERKKESEVAQL